MATSKSIGDTSTSKITFKDEKRSSTGQVRRTTNAFFNVARTVSKIYDSDVSDGNSSDDDDDDNHNDHDDYDSSDSDIDEQRDGDEPLSEQKHSNATSNILASSKDARDHTAARYKFHPEKIEPDGVIASKVTVENEKSKALSTQSVKTQKAIASTTEIVAKPVPARASSLSKPQSATAIPAEPTPTTPKPSTAPPATVPIPTPTPAKVDPLAPTAAAPYGYKIVTVKKPDGTIAKVKRPLKEGERPATATKKPAPAPTMLVTTSEDPKNTTTGGLSLPSPPVVDEKCPSTVTRSVSGETAKDVKDIKVVSNTVHPMEITEKPVSAPPLVSENSEKKAAAFQVTEKELERGLDSQEKGTISEVQLKGARKLARTFKVIVWVVGISFPTFFLALGIVTAALNRHPLPQAYQDLDSVDPLTQARTVAASAWPIVFAAVVAQSLKMYAAHRVERGIRLMTLEQLISSHSVGGAIKQPFLLRTFNWTTVILFFIWALSPLAGQSILRMSGTDLSFNATDTAVLYYSTETLRLQIPSNMISLLNTTNWDYRSFSDKGLNSTIANLSGDASSYPIPWTANTILNALIYNYNQAQQQNVDMYGNVRLLLGQASNDSNSSVDSRDRYNATVTYSTNQKYSSLLGFPNWITSWKGIAEATSNPDQSTSFTMLSQYFVFNCTTPVLIDAYGETMQSYGLTFNPQRTLCVSAQNNTRYSFPQTGHTYPDPTANQTYLQPGSEGELYLASIPTNDVAPIDRLWFTQCPYHSVLINSTVICNDIEKYAKCYSTQSLIVPNGSLTNYPLGYWFPWSLQRLADFNTPPNYYSDFENFIFNPTWASSQDSGGLTGDANSFDLGNVSATNISTRLGLTANAFWTVGAFEIAPFVGPDVWSWNKFGGMNASGWVTLPVYQYQVYWPWLGVLIGCSTLLMIAAIAAAIWETRVVGPDFLGFANTAVKKSVKMPKSMSTMNARDRLHALHETEVLLQDGKPNAPIGKIILGVKEEGSTRLTRGRQYR